MFGQSEKNHVGMVLPQNMEELAAVEKECLTIVNRRALTSAGASLIPIPGTDIVADVAMLMEMIPAINRKFGLSQEQIEAMDLSRRPVLLEFIKKVGNGLIGNTVTQELIIALLKKIGGRLFAKQASKIVPIIGQLTAASVSYAAMRYVGRAHVRDCYRIVKDYLDKRDAFEVPVTYGDGE